LAASVHYIWPQGKLEMAMHGSITKFQPGKEDGENNFITTLWRTGLMAKSNNAQYCWQTASDRLSN
jgi:hypothetical protein